MDSDVPSSPASGVDAKTSFRKPLSDAANRKYRRRSPVSGSSSSDGGPNHERSSSPIPLKEDDRRRKDYRRDFDRDSGRSRYGRSGDSDRHFDRQSYRSSHSYNRHDDYNRHDKHANDNEREHSKFSQHSGRNSRGGIHSDYAKRESEHNKSRDDFRDVDKFSVDRFDGSGHRNRDKERKPSSLEYQRYNDKEALFDRARSSRRYSNTEDVKSEEQGHHKGDRDSQDEKRDHRRSLGDHKRERSPTYGDSKGYQNDSNSRRDSSRHRLKGASESDPKEQDVQMYAKEEKKKYDDWETSRHHERYKREPGEQFEDRTALTSKDEEFPAKKPKLFGLVGGTNDGKDVASKFTNVTDERQSSSSKQAQESVGNVTLEQDFVKDSDIDAAKVAAMKAAELVNRNLIGTGYMSTDQKKKLLWGSKKSTTTEETAHPWDTALFGDRERQEKFNKLMSLRLPWYLWPIVGFEGRCESRAETRQPRWQWPPSSREAEGTSDGFGEAIHCWTSSTRWPYSWTRSLRTYLECFCTYMIAFSNILAYCNARSVLLLWHGQGKM